MKVIAHKTYDLKNGFGVDCITRVDMAGNKQYVVEVVMLTVPWRECVDRYECWNNPDACNSVFKSFVAKYRYL